jgi:hypothetical protein
MHDHKSFWLDLGGKIGPAVFSATLVGCLLAERFEVIHGVLMGTGLVLIGIEHWYAHHRRATTT